LHNNQALYHQQDHQARKELYVHVHPELTLPTQSNLSLCMTHPILFKPTHKEYIQHMTETAKATSIRAEY
jgi:hypothetical protein